MVQKTARRTKMSKATAAAETVASVKDTLEKTAQQLDAQHDRMMILHQQWRTHLLRLSWLMVLLAMYQLQTPMTECVKDIKAYNDATENEPYTGAQMIQCVLLDTWDLLCAILVVAALSYCLGLNTNVSQTGSLFSDSRFALASFLTIPIVLKYVLQISHDNTEMDNVSCIEDAELAKVGVVPQERQRGPYVVLVFYVIVTVCAYFMDSQEQQLIRHVKKLQDVDQQIDREQWNQSMKKSK